MMLGMYVAYFFFAALRRAGVFGTTFGPFVAAVLAARCCSRSATSCTGADLARHRHAHAQLEGEGHYAQLILTLGIALILQNGGQIVFGSILVSIRTPLSSSAWEIGPLWGDLICDLRQQVARHRGADLGRDHRRAGAADRAHAARQVAARRRRQSRSRDLHGHRRRPRAPHRLCARRRRHGDRRRPARHQLSVPSLCRARIRHRHVCRRGAGRHGQHHRRRSGAA